jgi:hypothetical protein
MKYTSDAASTSSVCWYLHFVGSTLTDIIIRSRAYKIFFAYILCTAAAPRRAFVTPAIITLTFARTHHALRASSLTLFTSAAINIITCHSLTG